MVETINAMRDADASLMMREPVHEQFSGRTVEGQVGIRVRTQIPRGSGPIRDYVRYGMGCSKHLGQTEILLEDEVPVVDEKRVRGHDAGGGLRLIYAAQPVRHR